MVWDNNPSISAAMRYLDVSGLRVKYKGPGSDDRDAAAIRTTSSVPSNCPIFYWEVEIINKGRDGFIGIGFSVQEVKLDRLPGWEPHSYGYHGDDGHVFNGRGTGRPYGPVFGTGDWIGIIFNRIERTISFTKKGYDLDVAFHNVPEDHLFPTVGFRTPDEEVRLTTFFTLFCIINHHPSYINIMQIERINFHLSLNQSITIHPTLFRL